MSKPFNLPGSNKITTSVKVYIREWEKITHPLERLTGWRVTGFDPGLNLSKLRLLPNGKTAYDYSLQIPVEFAQAILKGLKK
jgi:hypothetical protein